MKRGFACIMALGLAALTDTRVMAQRRGPPGADQRASRQHEWLSSLDDGMAAARQSGKPLMVVIRCGP